MYKHYQRGYYVSDKGKVKRIRKGKPYPVRLFENNCGYQYFVMLQTKQRIFLHRAVASCFLPKPHKGKYHVDHIDRNKKNNNVINLRWTTPQENMNNRGNRRERSDPR